MPRTQISAELLDILACPVCHGKLDPGPGPLGDPAERFDWLRCRECDRYYPIENGIPVMIEGRATTTPPR